MNHTQKLADEALQVYRATGLSPLQLMAQNSVFLLDMATVHQLDRFGRLVGTLRKDGEPCSEYRERIREARKAIA